MLFLWRVLGLYICPFDLILHAHTAQFLGYTLIAQKKDDVLSDKFSVHPLTSCLIVAIIAE